MCRNFYLDTNAIYALANYMEELGKYKNVVISLLGIEEIVSKLNHESQFKRRKILVENIIKNKIHIYPYLPSECIAMAFKLDISNYNFVIKEKQQLWTRFKLLSNCESYEEYREKLNENQIDIDLILNEREDIKKSISCKFNESFRNEHKNIKKQELIRKENPQYIEFDVANAFLEETQEQAKMSKRREIEPILIQFLENINCKYDEEDIDMICEQYNAELTTFLLGVSLYGFMRSHKGENSGQNDYIDMKHLLYIRNENDIIVSDDNIFGYTTIFKQRKSIYEFKKQFGIE